jgi:PAS domain S-box-containing protein
MIQAADEGRVAPDAVGKYLAQIAIVFAVQFAAGKLGDALAINSGGIGPVWPASGIALAALVLFGYQVWPGVAAGAFLLAFLSPIPHIAAAVYAAGTTLAALTGMFLLRRVVNFCTSLSRLRDALGLIVFGAFGSSLVSASTGVSLLYAAHVRGWSGFGSAWLIYWLGDSMGVLLVTPLVLTFPNLLRIRPRVRIAEFTALLLFVTVACFIVFCDLPLIPVRLHVLAFAVLPFVMWAAIRFGVSGATLSTFFVAAIATAATVLGSGPFAKNNPFTNAVLLDVFFAVLSVSGMTLAAAIAEREEAEREREQSIRSLAAMGARLRLATIVESSDDAIIGMDMNGMITDWNAGAERLYGYSAGEVGGKMISLLVPPGRSDDCADIMSKVKHGDRLSHHETVCQKKDGTCVEVSLTVSPIIDTEGRSIGSSAITRDITQLKRQEAVLRESEERFRLVADTAPVLIWMSGTDKLCTYFNKPWLDFTGRSIDEELGNGWASGVHPEDLQRCLDTYTQSFDRREKFRMEYRLRRHDGEYRWILDIGVPRFGEDRSFVGYIGIGVDVTDRKRAEEERRESEDKLRLLLDSTAEAIYGIDLEHRCTFCNPACLRTLGYEHVDQVLGKNTHDLIHHTRSDGTLFPAEECRVHRVTRTGEGVHAEDEVFWRANGTSFPVEYWSYPQRRGEAVVGAVVAFTDITERKLAEERLRESEEQFRTLAEAIPQLCWMAHGDGHIFWYNQRWYTYTGTTPEQMEGWGWQSVHDPEILPHVLERWKTSIATGEPLDMVFPLRAADGAFHPFLTRVTPVKDSEGRVVSWFGTNTDITELRDSQEALRTSEERLRMGQWVARLGTYEWNIRTGVSIWTPELEALYGLPPGGFGGTRDAFENLVHPDDRARVIHLIDEAIKTGQPTEGEWRVVWSDGSLHWIAARGQVFMNKSGEPSRMFGVHLDVTERKRAEEALSDMTRKLVEAQEQERARIARELHDDINQRLAMLAIELEQLQDDPSEVRSRVQELRKRTTEISNDVQALSHDLHSSQLDYLGVVAGMKSWCKEFGERQGMQIACRHDVRSTLPPEIGLCLFRILQEALHNVSKHSGVKQIEVQLREESGEIHLTVSDSGRGFNVEAVKQGKGLGLMSMQERVRLVNGMIEIQSKPMGGTTIHARVPLGSEHDSQRAVG